MPDGYDADLNNLLLSYCYSALMPVEILRRDNVNEVLNMPHHGLAQAALVRRLQRLVAREWLQVSLRSGDALPPDKGTAALAPMFVLSKDAARDVFLSITPAGGRVWEAFAKPRWWAFISNEGTEVVHGSVHLIYRSPLRKTIEAFGDLLGYWTILRRAPRTIRTVGTWRPMEMPWKGFPRGCELRIDTGADPASREGGNYECNDFTETDPRLNDILMYTLSVWEVPFRFALQELDGRLEQQ
jgi:hypothetical protein